MTSMTKQELRNELDCANLARRHAEVERDRLKAILKRFADLDCCAGYSLSRKDYVTFWDALDDARAELGFDVHQPSDSRGSAK